MDSENVLFILGIVLLLLILILSYLKVLKFKKNNKAKELMENNYLRNRDSINNIGLK